MLSSRWDPKDLTLSCLFVDEKTEGQRKSKRLDNTVILTVGMGVLIFLI